MSRGTTLTLYRAYRKFKVPDATISEAIAKEVEKVRKFYGKNISATDEQIAERVSPILSAYVYPGNVSYWEADDPETIEDYRLRNHTSTFLREEGIWCDRLLEWDFCSTFDALVEHWGMSCYGENRMRLITSSEAEKMLAAAEYLLSCAWESKVLAPANEYVNILATGNSCWDYAKYTKRKKLEAMRRVHTFSDAGCRITVELPRVRKMDWDEEDERCDEELESHLRLLASALHTFLDADNWASEKWSKLVLSYQAWG